MNKILFILCLLLPFSFTINAAESKNKKGTAIKQRYFSPNKSFSIQLPGSIAMSPRVVKYHADALAEEVVLVNDNGSAFSIITIKFSEEIRRKEYKTDDALFRMLADDLVLKSVLREIPKAKIAAMEGVQLSQNKHGLFVMLDLPEGAAYIKGSPTEPMEKWKKLNTLSGYLFLGKIDEVIIVSYEFDDITEDPVNDFEKTKKEYFAILKESILTYRNELGKKNQINKVQQNQKRHKYNY